MNWHSPLVIILFILIAFSFFFSACETALIGLNKVRLRHLMEERRRGARRVYSLVSRMDKLIATILVGNNLANTAIASISTLLLAQVIGEEKTLMYGTVVITAVLVVFCELTPKILATNHPEGVAFFFRHMVSFFIYIFQPVTQVLTWVSNGIIKIFGGNPHHRSPLVTEEEIKMMITIGKEQGYYGDNERKMLERIFHFDDTEVRDVMTPIEDMTSVPIDGKEEEIERTMMEEGHNRIPVYQGTPSNVVGIVYVRDLLYLFKNKSLIQLSDLISAPFFVPPHKKVAELLKEFQARKVHIAIVRDTVTQKAIGLVTLEDLVEEIVGEIEEIQP
jgi:putative hemolysin